MKKPERDPTDPADPFYAMAEMFRRDVTKMVINAHSVTLYRELDRSEQIETFVLGALAGIVGACFAVTTSSDGADAMMDYISENLPYARKVAESLIDPSGKPVFKRHDGPRSGQ